MVPSPNAHVDLNDFTQRDRQAEIAKIAARRADRDRMRRAFRRRRAIAVAVLALPIAGFVVAGRFPSEGSTPTSSAADTAAAPAATAASDPTRIVRFPAPAEVRAVHLSMHLAANGKAVQKLIAAHDPATGLNAIQLDIKDETGEIGFTDGMPELAVTSGAARDIYEPRIVVEQLHDAGFYVIGRIVAFQDPVLAPLRPKRAIIAKDGTIWLNDNGKAWLNPYSKANWRYLIDIAKAAGQAGFDEIQFDYVRFPTDGDLSTVELNRSSRKMEAAISGFLKQAVHELHKTDVRVSADLFGLAASGDIGIGQNPRELRDILDVISPMIYPQGYADGTYNIPCPVCSPAETIRATLEEWAKVIRGGTAELRPWLQAYDWQEHDYTGAEVMAQVAATREFTSRGFMLWHPSVTYDDDMLSFPAGP
jgi:hypothetical protein